MFTRCSSPPHSSSSQMSMAKSSSSYFPGRTSGCPATWQDSRVPWNSCSAEHHQERCRSSPSLPLVLFLIVLGSFDKSLISLSPIKFSPQNQHMGSHYQHRKGSLCAWQHQHDGHHLCMCYIIVTLFTQGSMCAWQQTALARENLHLLTSKSFVS